MAGATTAPGPRECRILVELLTHPNFDAYLTLAVLGVMFVVFVLEVYPVEVTAMLGAAVLVLFGVVPTGEVLDVFANPAPGRSRRCSSSRAGWCGPASSACSRGRFPGGRDRTR
jgi:di/tricarboxylate transporter